MTPSIPLHPNPAQLISYVMSTQKYYKNIFKGGSDQLEGS